MDVVGVVVLASAKCARLFNLRVCTPLNRRQMSFRSGAMQRGVARL